MLNLFLYTTQHKMLGDGTTTYLIFLCTFPLNDTQEKGREREKELLLWSLDTIHLNKSRVLKRELFLCHDLMLWYDIKYEETAYSREKILSQPNIFQFYLEIISGRQEWKFRN